MEAKQLHEQPPPYSEATTQVSSQHMMYPNLPPQNVPAQVAHPISPDEKLKLAHSLGLTAKSLHKLEKQQRRMEHRERRQAWKEDKKNRKIERKIEKMERKDERKWEKKQRKMWRKLEDMGECNCCCCEYYKTANGERELHLAEAEIHQMHISRNHPNAIHPTSPAVLTSREMTTAEKIPLE